MKNKIPIARCPNCGRTVLYSDDPRDKLTVTVRAADESYHGKAMPVSYTHLTLPTTP